LFLYKFPADADGRSKAYVRIVADDAIVFSDLNQSKGDCPFVVRVVRYNRADCFGEDKFVGFSWAHG
jgi:DNA-binding cell septation regulator SpoVG